MTDQAKEQSVEGRVVWILVDSSLRAAAFEPVAEALGQHDVHVEIVTMTEVISSMARDAIAGGAERVLRGLRVAVQGRHSDEDFIGAVRRVRPDALAVTSPRYVRALSLLESLTGISSLQLGVLPDYNLDDQWLKSSLHAFIVPHGAQADKLRRQGVEGNRVMIAGPPVQRGFTTTVDKAQARDDFGFSHGEKIIFVRADHFGIGDLEKLIFQCKLVEGNVRFIFHHNGDGSVAAELRRAANEYGFPAIMFGKVNDLERYVAMADAVIAVPHEPLLAEIIAQGKPVMLVGSDMQAVEQTAFLTSMEMARHTHDMLRLGSEIERFLKDETLERFTEAASSIGLPDGSKEVAAAIVNALQNVNDLMSGGTSAQSGTEEEPSQDDTPTNSAFESIGKDKKPKEDNPRHDDRRDAPADDNKYAGISQAEAKEQMAQLILVERDLERRLGELEKEQQRWRERLDLAREWQEEDLAEEASGILRGYLNEARGLQEELQGVRVQKDKLRSAVQNKGGKSTGQGATNSRVSQMEQRFRKMEENRDLNALKDRLNREFGDD